MSPFQGCRDRIERATAHREALGKTWADFIEEDPYDVFIKVESDGTGTIKVHPSRDLPASCTLDLGEFLYQLRAALDGAVYAAAVIESGQHPPPNENQLEFPICTRTADFNKSSGKIAPLSQKCRDFIEAIQPYNTPPIATGNLTVLNINRNLGIINDWA